VGSFIGFSFGGAASGRLLNNDRSLIREVQILVIWPSLLIPQLASRKFCSDLLLFVNL
jgi:hypothetical protein